MLLKHSTTPRPMFLFLFFLVYIIILGEISLGLGLPRRFRKQIGLRGCEINFDVSLLLCFYVYNQMITLFQTSYLIRPVNTQLLYIIFVQVEMWTNVDLDRELPDFISIHPSFYNSSTSIFSCPVSDGCNFTGICNDIYIQFWF